MADAPQTITPKPTTAVDRIAAALKEGGYVKGARGPNHGKKINGVLRLAIPHIELLAGDLLEACNLCKNKTDIVLAQTKGSSANPPDSMVAIYADDAFHIVEQAGL